MKDTSFTTDSKQAKTLNVYSVWFIETQWYLDFMPSMEYTYHNQTSIVSIFLRTHDDGFSSFPSVPLRTVLIKSLQVRGIQCLGLGEVPIRERS